MIVRILKYYKIIFLVTVLLMKFRILQLTSSDSELLSRVKGRFRDLKEREERQNSVIPKAVLVRRVITVFKRLYQGAGCLARSVVLNEILLLHGYKDEKVKFGIRFENDKILAHAWVSSPCNYKIVSEL